MHRVNNLHPIFVGTECNEENHKALTHLHSYVEIVKSLEDHLSLRIDGKELELNKGDICLINQRHHHQIFNKKNHSCLRKSVIFDPFALIREERIISSYLDPMLKDPSLNYIIFDHRHPSNQDLSKIIENMEHSLHEKSSGYILEVMSLLFLLLRIIYLSYLQREDNLSLIDYDEQIQRRMTSYIYEHYQEKISLEDIANIGHVSISKCSKMFKKYVQMSPIDFLNNYRLEVSSKQLKETTKSISEIAQDCGFSQQSYFNRLFLRAYHCTPRQYRIDKSPRKVYV